MKNIRFSGGEPKFDLAELAKRRWIEGLSRKALAQVYGKSESAIQSHFQVLKHSGFCVPGLADEESKRILWVLKS